MSPLPILEVACIMRKTILVDFPEDFAICEIREKSPNTSDETIRRVLRELKEKDIIKSTGRGRSSRWVKCEE